jgi:hypothetical protein
MNRAQIGRVMIGFGVLLVLAGVIGLLTGGSEEEPVAAPSAQTTEPPTTTPPATDPSSTTTTAQTPTTTSSSTTISSSTTTTTLPPEAVDDFVLAFREALEADDLDFAFSRLHPAVIEAYGEDLCRAWTEREILALDEYQTTGPFSELGETTVNLPDGAVPVAELFEVPISFVFQGQFFEDNASFAREDGLIYWLGNCR